MTRKSTLIEWAHHLGVVADSQQAEEMTAAQIEMGISEALVKRDRLTANDEPQHSLREGVANNWGVIRQELPGTIRAVVNNLRGA